MAVRGLGWILASARDMCLASLGGWVQAQGVREKYIFAAQDEEERTKWLSILRHKQDNARYIHGHTHRRLTWCPDAAQSTYQYCTITSPCRYQPMHSVLVLGTGTCIHV